MLLVGKRVEAAPHPPRELGVGVEDPAVEDVDGDAGARPIAAIGPVERECLLVDPVEREGDGLRLDVLGADRLRDAARRREDAGPPAHPAGRRRTAAQQRRRYGDGGAERAGRERNAAAHATAAVKWPEARQSRLARGTNTSAVPDRLRSSTGGRSSRARSATRGRYHAVRCAASPARCRTDRRVCGSTAPTLRPRLPCSARRGRGRRARSARTAPRTRCASRSGSRRRAAAWRRDPRDRGRTYSIPWLLP